MLTPNWLDPASDLSSGEKESLQGLVPGNGELEGLVGFRNRLAQGACPHRNRGCILYALVFSGLAIRDGFWPFWKLWLPAEARRTLLLLLLLALLHPCLLPPVLKQVDLLQIGQ